MKRLVMVSVIIFALAIGGAVVYAVSGNQAGNPGFEYEPWVYAKSSCVNAGVGTVEDGVTGRSLHTHIKSSTCAGGAEGRQIIWVPPGTSRVNVSTKARCWAGNDARGELRLRFLDTGNNQKGPWLTVPNTTNDGNWRTLSGGSFVPSGAYYAQVFVKTWSFKAGGKRHCAWDDVSVTMQ